MREVVKWLDVTQRKLAEQPPTNAESYFFLIGLEPIGSLSRYGDQSANHRQQNIKVISSPKGQTDGLTLILFCFLYRGRFYVAMRHC